ncbi:DUF308 domain-containing protein [Cellulosimicrobium marinum]|uniref:DUF308 domain-containing protein n=1 Tax=Cellulosimicrobium marinum TaxID=1638992 RepID=UPI001E319D79|nr:DUF308 domain-containing protein [Cellulosimicrobium marinum]MCB7135722.1 DUF308 domain-containing protein [Cellulosimicrobium marinum]
MSDDGATMLSDRAVGTARRLWGLVYLRAAAYLVVGVVLFVRPDDGLRWLRWLLALVIFVQGVILALEGSPGRGRRSGGSGSRSADDDGVGWRLVAGIVSVVAAVLIAVWPSMSGPLLFRVVGIWACVAGVIGVLGALRARRSRTPGWDWQLANAVLWLVLGVVLLARPTDSWTTAALLVALYLVVAGVVLLVGAFATSTAVSDRRRAETETAPPEPDVPAT